MTSTLQTIFPICSGAIAIIGCLSNALSLSYFIKFARGNFTNKLFMALNVFDLLVSLLHVPIAVIWFCTGYLCGGDGPLFVIFLALTENTIGCTAFLTCLLSVTRTLSLIFPFYIIRKKAVELAGLAFIAQEVVRTFLWYHFFYFRPLAERLSYIFVHFSIVIVLLAAVIFVNVVSLALSGWKLLSQRKLLEVSPNAGTDNQIARDKIGRRATVTILIVTVLFLVTNSLFCIALTLKFHFNQSYSAEHMPMFIFYNFSLWLSVPLNSAINPLIYLARKREMRRHAQDIICCH